MSNSATRNDIEVIFSLEKGQPCFTYSGTTVTQKGPEREATLQVAEGTSLIVFTLKAGRGVNNVAFISRPFQYVDSQDGITTPLPHPPPGFLLQRNTETQATLIAINTVAGAIFRFFLIIIADGVIHGDDPTMINEPEGGS